jgi:hypothetical protein
MLIENKELRYAFRLTGFCEWCERRVPVDPAHVFAVGSGGGGRLDVRINLVALCRICHTNAHNGAGPTFEQLLDIVAKREGIQAQDIVDVVHFLRRTPNRPIALQREKQLRELEPSAQALARSILATVPMVA